MQFIQGKDRTQSVLYAESLDQIVELENEVRIIDLFVESIQLADFDFKIKTTFEGRPAFHPKDLLKLFVYGYLNRIRSSRSLEKECRRNIELIWLLKHLVPDHNTISNFRKDNPEAIKKVFRYTVSIAKEFNLIGGILIAGDSTKLRAQNSKKNNFNPKKIAKHLAYIDGKLTEYNNALENADDENKTTINAHIAKHSKHKLKYERMQEDLNASGDTQISTSDPESRQMITRNNITEVAYNVQTVVDAKHCIPIDYKVTNENDSKAMGSMLESTVEILQKTQFTALYDKGYHTGSELKTGMDLGITVMVAIPEVASNAPDEGYNVANFKYDEILDTYTCPQGETLFTNENWYKKNRGKSFTQVKHYKTNACESCAVKELCTRNPKGRLIERSEHAQYVEQNKINIENNPELYRQRQSIVEHPYGTIKRQWGFYYILTKKTMKRASADVGFMFIAYNMRRLINILGQEMFKKFLEELGLLFMKISNAVNLITFKMPPPVLSTTIALFIFKPSLNSLKIDYI
jgi:transposase